MRLDHTGRYSAGECWICKTIGAAGAEACLIVVWPKQPVTEPQWMPDDYQDLSDTRGKEYGTWTIGEWHCYVKSEDENISNHRQRRMPVCVKHYSELFNEWIELVRSEVAETEAWNSYLERKER